MLEHLRPLLPPLFAMALAAPGHGQSTASAPLERAGDKEPDKPRLSVLVGYLTNGSTGVRKLTPELYLGFDEPLFGKDANAVRVQFGPAVSADGLAVDSADALRALSLPGSLSFGMLLYRRLTPTGDFDLTIGSGAGIKAIAAQSDSTVSILQHSVRMGVALQFKQRFVIGFQHTWGWHDLTDESLANFQTAFGTRSDAIRYITASAMAQIANTETYFFAAWRRVTKNDHISMYGNRRKSLILGVRQDICITCTMPMMGARPQARD